MQLYLPFTFATKAMLVGLRVYSQGMVDPVSILENQETFGHRYKQTNQVG